MEREKMDDDEELKVVLLPPDIITEILSRLAAESAIGCKVICKQWRSLIDDTCFRDTHTQQLISSSPYNPKKFGNHLIPNSYSSGFFMYVNRKYKLEVVEYNDGGSGDEKRVPVFKPCKPIIENSLPLYGDYYWDDLLIISCNGLVFMVFKGSTKPIVNDMFICNPFTREHVHLRSSIRAANKWCQTQQVTGDRYIITYGFGYHPCTNEYKVVSIYYDRSMKSKGGKVGVYTLGSGKWRDKGEIPYKFYTSRPSFIANGAIHWVTCTDNQIVSFDLADEKFRVVVPFLPPPFSVTCIDEYGVLGGCLCVTAKSKKSIDIWVLDVRTTNNNQKKKFSWNKKFSIPGIRGTYAKPLEVTKSGKIVLCDGFTLFCYDPKTEAFVYEIILPCSDDWGKIITYTKSFVSLKALGEKDVKTWSSVADVQALAQQRAAVKSLKKSWHG